MRNFHWVLAISQAAALLFIYQFSGPSNRIEMTTFLINASSIYWTAFVGVFICIKSLRLRTGIEDTDANKLTLLKLSAVAPILFTLLGMLVTYERGGLSCSF